MNIEGESRTKKRFMSVFLVSLIALCLSFSIHLVFPIKGATQSQSLAAKQVPARKIPASSVPLLAKLEGQGYVNKPIYRFRIQTSGATYFSNQGMFGHIKLGGPNFDEPFLPESLSTELPSGKTCTYIQYMTPGLTSCRLLFLISEGDNRRVIADLDVTDLSHRVKKAVGEGISPLFCMPYGWHDANENGRPEMPVTILWGNNYTGGEVHIFEFTDDERVTDLTANIPGPVFHWQFDPRRSKFMVVDLAWDRHHCLYPNSPFAFWVYGWNGESYANVTPKVNHDDYISFLESLLNPSRPFEPDSDIGPLVSLLLTYDYSGRRELGWKRFLELADLKNWPGTEPEALALLLEDIEHFKTEYKAGAVFTPSETGCTPSKSPAKSGGRESKAIKEWKDPVTGMEFVWVPGGCYEMGCGSWTGDCFSDEKPAHEVCVDAFWIGMFEVTQGEWKKIMGSAPASYSDGDDYPVGTVSWNEVKEFIEKLNARSSDRRYRLPTEAEWEYACRSGGKEELYSGGNELDQVAAWYGSEKDEGYYTRPVGTKASNGLGIYDMSGNLWEWCEDVYDENAYSKHGRNNPVVMGGGSARVIRGGSWYQEPRSFRCTGRTRVTPDDGEGLLGFRLVREP